MDIDLLSRSKDLLVREISKYQFVPTNQWASIWCEQNSNPSLIRQQEN